MSGTLQPTIGVDTGHLAPDRLPVARPTEWGTLQGDRFPLRIFDKHATAVVGLLRRDGELQISVLGDKGRAYKNVLLYDTVTGIFEVVDQGGWTDMLRRHSGSAAWLAVLYAVCSFVVQAITVGVGVLCSALNSFIFFGLIGLVIFAFAGYLLFQAVVFAATVGAPFAIMAFAVDRLERHINARQSQRIFDQMQAALSSCRRSGSLPA